MIINNKKTYGEYGAVLISKDNNILLLNEKSNSLWGVISGHTAQYDSKNIFMKNDIYKKTGIYLGRLYIRGKYQFIHLNKNSSEYIITLSSDYVRHDWVPFDKLTAVFDKIKLNDKSRQLLSNYISRISKTVENKEVEKIITEINDSQDTNKSYGAVLRSTDDKILIIRERASGMWGVPKGKRKRNETKNQCISREILEETGIHIKLTKKYDSVCPLFQLKKPHNEYTVKIQESEILDYEWINSNSIDQVLMKKRFNMVSKLALLEYREMYQS